MKKLIALLATVCLSVTPVVVFAEDTSDTFTTDVLDNSAEQKEVEENGIPNETLVLELKETADGFYAEEKYEEAGDAYYETARKANYLANIMRQCIEPYYSSKSEYPNTPDEIWDDLITFEQKANEMIELRDICYVYQGICYHKLGDDESSLAVLYRALDIITDSETEAWVMASQQLMELVGHSAIGSEYADLRKEAEKYEGKSVDDFIKNFGEPNNIREEDDFYTGKYNVYYYDAFNMFSAFEGGKEVVDFIG